MSTIVIILLGVAALIAWTMFGGSSKADANRPKPATSKLKLVERDGHKIDREWWPRFKVIGQQRFPFVRIKDVDKVGEWPHLERWWHRESMGKYYDVIVDGAEFLDPDEYNEDKFEMKRGWEAIYEDGRLFLEWAAIRTSMSDKKNMYEVTANVCERVGRFPWELEKEHKNYLHKRSWNSIVKKAKDTSEVIELVEAKMKANAAKLAKS
jgi:hypothetical protein